MNLRQRLNESRFGKSVNETYLGSRVQDLSDYISDSLKAFQLEQVPTDELFIPYLFEQVHQFKSGFSNINLTRERVGRRFGEVLSRLYQSTNNGTTLSDDSKYFDQTQMRKQLDSLVLDYKLSLD